MGCCTSCCRQTKSEYQEIKGSAEEGREGEGGRGGREDAQREEKTFAWEQEFLETKTSQWNFVTHAAIVSFSSGVLRAAIPKDFIPSQTGVNDIISALQGITSGLEQNNVALGGNTPVCIPGKFDDKALYCSDSQGGGCIAMKTKDCLLVVFYNGNADTASTLTSEMAEFMENNGR